MRVLCHVISLYKRLEDIFVLKHLEHKVDFGVVVGGLLVCLGFFMLYFAFFLSLSCPRRIKGQKFRTKEHI